MRGGFCKSAWGVSLSERGRRMRAGAEDEGFLTGDGVAGASRYPARTPSSAR